MLNAAQPAASKAAHVKEATKRPSFALCSKTLAKRTAQRNVLKDLDKLPGLWRVRAAAAAQNLSLDALFVRCTRFFRLGPDVNECGTDAMFQCNSEGESGAESTEDDADLADLLADWRPGPYVAYSHSEDDEAADDRSGLSVCVFVCVCVYLCACACARL